MKVVVFPHDLGIGGSQLNAIDLAASMRDHGHQVTVFGSSGPLLERIEAFGLDFVTAPPPRRRPSPAIVSALGSLIRDRGIDLIHAYEWPPILESWLASHRLPQVNVVGTVMSMAVAPFIPRRLPLLVGTEQIGAVERRNGRARVKVQEPPVDLRHNSESETRGLDSFRERWSISAAELNVVAVSRLASELKSEGLLSAIAGMALLTDECAVRLIIVGGGPAEGQIRAAADQTNALVGREVVTLTGELLDPRPAYALGDVHLAMGGSALRAMSFGKPLVVQGEGGYFKLLEPGTAGEFLWAGWYGVGNDATAGPDQFVHELRKLIDDPEQRAQLGAYGRQLVEDRFSLTAAAGELDELYRNTAAEGPQTSRTRDACRSAIEFGTYSARRRIGRLRRRDRADDFNSRPVAALGLSREQLSPVPSERSSA